jgi:hypothetical protein
MEYSPLNGSIGISMQDNFPRYVKVPGSRNVVLARRRGEFSGEGNREHSLTPKDLY